MTGSLTDGEWQRAQQSLGAAWLCQRAGFYADAISRAYYAMLHAAKAALQLYGVSARSHAGVRNRFALNIVRVGLVEGHWSAEIGSIGFLRGMADYNVTKIFDETEAHDVCERAEAFVNRIRRLLADSDPAE